MIFWRVKEAYEMFLVKTVCKYDLLGVAEKHKAPPQQHIVGRRRNTIMDKKFNNGSALRNVGIPRPLGIFAISPARVLTKALVRPFKCLRSLREYFIPLLLRA